MRWIKYQILQSTIGEENILINKKIGYSTENVAIAQKEAYNGEYTVVEDSTDFTKEPIPIEEGGTGATTAEQARENLGVSEAIPDMTAEELIGLTDFEEGTPDNIIPKATKSLLGCVVVGDGLEVDDNAVLSANHMIKLWENASPTSSFAAQMVNLDLNSYGLVYVVCKESTTESKYISLLATKGNVFRLICLYNARHVREFIMNNDGIAFESAYHASQTGTMANDNTYMIPTAIYGIKGVK